jgi:hypothetical protein
VTYDCNSVIVDVSTLMELFLKLGMLLGRSTESQMSAKVSSSAAQGRDKATPAANV